MIYLNFTPPNTVGWKDWVKRCKKAAIKLIKDYNESKPFKISKDLYSEQKGVFNVSPFYEKCAYCESKLPVNSPTYVEHYRPKGGVRYFDNNRVFITQNDNDIPHPGYFWLAYDWENLLPTCWACNTWQKKLKIGKGNRFPVVNSHASRPEDVKNEEHLLINPMLEDPAAELYIDKLGIIHKKIDSIKGDTTIKVFGLNEREALYTSRKEVYENARRKVKNFLAMDECDPEYIKELDEIKEIQQGKSTFSIAGRKAIDDEYNRQEKRFLELKNNYLV